MIISVASGKGGTGKTTVAVNLALSLNFKEKLQFIDCDVEEPNADIFIKPSFENTEPVIIPVPHINMEKCTFCGRCVEICAFNALAVLADNILVFSELCHGCGGCAYFCPEKAIEEVPRKIGSLEEGSAGDLEFLRGRLNPGEPMSPPLIKALKKKIDLSKNVIIDSPPGTSCPAVTSVKNTDFCLLVTEPTPFGLSDLQLSVEMLKALQLPAGVVINRSDGRNSIIEDYCTREGIPVLMQIPWDLELARLYARGEPVVPYAPRWKEYFIGLWKQLELAAGSKA